MKVVFADKSFVECAKSETPGKIRLTIKAKDQDNPLKKITNTVEMTVDEFKLLISDMQ